MTKDWTFDQPLDDNTPTSSTEERAKIAALFHKENQESVEDVDYVAALNTYSHWFNALDKTVSEEITQNVISAGLDSILCQNPCQTHN